MTIKSILQVKIVGDFCLQLKVEIWVSRGGEGLSSEIHNTVTNFLPKITDFWKGLTF